MLPRLRFVVAAIAIAMLPMMFLGSGFVTTAHDTYLAGPDVPLGGNRLSEPRDAQLLVLAYARRNSELERLRDLANLPLRTWVQAPSGAPVVEAPPPTPAVRIALAPPDRVPDVVASAPPVITDAGDAGETASVPVQRAPPAEVVAAGHPLSFVPLPRKRPKVTAAKRHRFGGIRHARRSPFALQAHTNPPGLFEDLGRSEQARPGTTATVTRYSRRSFRRGGATAQRAAIDSRGIFDPRMSETRNR